MADNLERRVDRIENNLDRLSALTLVLADRLDAAVQRQDEMEKRFDQRMYQMTLKHEEMDEALTALIHTVDDWIRRNPRNGSSQ